jgi:hypothetical protein
MAVRALREHRAALLPGSAATFADGTACEVFPGKAGQVRKANPDEEMLSRALTLQRALGRQVTVVTDDLCTQLRAGANGLAEAVSQRSTRRTPSGGRTLWRTRNLTPPRLLLAELRGSPYRFDPGERKPADTVGFARRSAVFDVAHKWRF